MAWLILIVAGALEVVWAYYMKLSGGFTRPVPTAVGSWRWVSNSARCVYLPRF